MLVWLATHTRPAAGARGGGGGVCLTGRTHHHNPSTCETRTSTARSSAPLRGGEEGGRWGCTAAKRSPRQAHSTTPAPGEGRGPWNFITPVQLATNMLHMNRMHCCSTRSSVGPCAAACGRQSVCAGTPDTASQVPSGARARHVEGSGRAAGVGTWRGCAHAGCCILAACEPWAAAGHTRRPLPARCSPSPPRCGCAMPASEGQGLAGSAPLAAPAAH